VNSDEYEAETIRRALAGDADAGREALNLCRAGLDAMAISRPLAAYLAERLLAIDKALQEAEQLRGVKKSSGSIRSARDAAIAEALCIKRPAFKPRDPLPDWQVPYAAFGTLLLKAGLRKEQVKASMDEARRLMEGADKGLDRSQAGDILRAYLPMREVEDELLLHLCGPLREILPTYLRQGKRT
jgi:hypothetical protein